jgi:hypothetical protein
MHAKPRVRSCTKSACMVGGIAKARHKEEDSPSH